MDEETKLRLSKRFAGYNFKKISLDETGPSFYKLPSYIHPYYRNQPQYWENSVFLASEPIMGPNSATASSRTASSTIGGTYGSGSSVSAINESNAGSEADCRSISPKDFPESLKKLSKNKKSRLFSLCKI